MNMLSYFNLIREKSNMLTQFTDSEIVERYNGWARKMDKFIMPVWRTPSFNGVTEEMNLEGNYVSTEVFPLYRTTEAKYGSNNDSLFDYVNPTGKLIRISCNGTVLFSAVSIDGKIYMVDGEICLEPILHQHHLSLGRYNINKHRELSGYVSQTDLNSVQVYVNRATGVMMIVAFRNNGRDGEHRNAKMKLPEVTVHVPDSRMTGWSDLGMSERIADAMANYGMEAFYMSTNEYKEVIHGLPLDFVIEGLDDLYEKSNSVISY